MGRMRRTARIRCTTCATIAILLAGTAAAGLGQSTLPPTEPTHRELPENPPSIEYSNGQIAVVADNSSLSEILQEVARHSGMAVKGSIVDERVFGTYGPAAPSEVLTALLKGTDSNMMVVDGPSRPAEIILTPRQEALPSPPAAATLEMLSSAAGDTEQRPEELIPQVDVTAPEAKPAKADDTVQATDPQVPAGTAEVPERSADAAPAPTSATSVDEPSTR